MSYQAAQAYDPPSPPSRRERPKSRLSFMSDQSGESKPKIDLTETQRDKHRLNFFSKANPNSAITEAEPGARAGIEGNTLGYLREVEHKDGEGNVIVDPDRSNPTRPRMERPLDTIRSFEAAIDSAYKRSDSLRADTASNFGGYSSRRSSSYNALDQYQGSRHQRQGGYHHQDRSVQYRQEYYDNSPQSYGRKPSNLRNHSEPIMFQRHSQAPYNAQFHSSNPYYEPYDTDHTASNGSGSTEPWGNSTDPSSENSSVDRMQYQYNKPDTVDPYARSPPIQQAVMEESGVGGRSYPQPNMRPPPPMNWPRSSLSQQNTNGAPQYRQDERAQVPLPLPPLPPQKSGKLSKLGRSDPLSNGLAPSRSNQSNNYNGNGPSYRPSMQTPPAPKRQSWLKRTFSTNRK